MNINHGSLNTAKSNFERKRGNEIEDLPCKPTETCESNKLEGILWQFTQEELYQPRRTEKICACNVFAIQKV